MSKARINHSNACRNRIQKEMAKDEAGRQRLEERDARERDYLSKYVEDEDRKRRQEREGGDGDRDGKRLREKGPAEKRKAEDTGEEALRGDAQASGSGSASSGLVRDNVRPDVGADAAMENLDDGFVNENFVKADDANLWSPEATRRHGGFNFGKEEVAGCVAPLRGGAVNA